MAESSLQSGTVDLAIHLIGEQILPNYAGIKQFNAREHLLISSSLTESVAERLRGYATKEGTLINILGVEPYDIPGMVRRLSKHLEGKALTRITWNLTGGTKPMFAAAFAVSRILKNATHEVVYLNTEARRIDHLVAPFAHAPLVPALNRVEQFVQLAGYPVATPGLTATSERIQQRASLTRALWDARLAIGSLMQDLLKARQSGRPRAERTLTSRNGKAKVMLKPDGSSVITLHKKDFALGPHHDVLAYLTGFWLEEYLLLKLTPLVEAGILKDLRQGFKPAWRGEDAKAGTAQDFDVAATDGFRLFIFECKLYKPGQDEVQKLENLAAQFGGHYGRGILVCMGKKIGAVGKRIAASRNLGLLGGDRIEHVNADLLTTKSGFIDV